MVIEREDWRPDWQDADAYSWLDTASGAQLAWEFLRRNPDYERSAYLIQVKKEEQLLKRFNGEKVNHKKLEAEEQALSLKYGVGCLFPVHAQSVHFSFRPPCYAPGWEEEGVFYDAVEPCTRGEVLVKFTLGSTLPLQFQAAERFLRSLPHPAEEAQAGRNRTKRLTLCLRALDGEVTLLKKGRKRIAYEIGKTLAPEKDRSDYAKEARSLLDQGRQMSDRKYRSLIFKSGQEICADQAQ